MTNHRDDKDAMTDEAIVSAEARVLDAKIELVRVEMRGKAELLGREVGAITGMVNENRRLFDIAYGETKNDLASIQSQLREWRYEMGASIDAHAAKDDAQFTRISAALGLGTSTMERTTEALVQLRKDVQPLVTALTYGRKTLAVASVITKFVDWAATKAGKTIITIITLVVALQWLWGKIPMPTWLIGIGGP